MNNVQPVLCPYCNNENGEMEERYLQEDLNGSVREITCVNCDKRWIEYWRLRGSGVNEFLSWERTNEPGIGD